MGNALFTSFAANLGSCEYVIRQYHFHSVGNEFEGKLKCSKVLISHAVLVNLTKVHEKAILTM